MLAAPEASVLRADSAEDKASRDGGDDARALSGWQQAGPCLGHVGYFVGAGLISGGIVHDILDPGRSLLVAAAGVAVFLLATVGNEVLLPVTTLPRARLVRVVGGSLGPPVRGGRRLLRAISRTRAVNCSE